MLVGTALWSVYSVLGTVYCGGNGAHIQDTMLVGTALWSVYSVYCVLWWEWGPHTGHHAGGDGLVVCVQCVLCTAVGMGPTYRTLCWWGRPCGLCTVCTVYCGGNGAHIQDTVLVGTALWSVYSVLGTVVGMGPTYRTPCWWGRPCGLCTVCTVYCGRNGAHIQDTVLVGTALWSVYSVYCVLWWELGPHTGHRAGGDGLVVCVQCVRYCVLWWEWGPHTGYCAGGTALWSVYSVYCVLWWEWGPHTGHRAGGDGLVVCVQCVLCTVVGMGPTYRTPCWWGRPCGLCTVC